MAGRTAMRWPGFARVATGTALVLAVTADGVGAGQEAAYPDPEPADPSDCTVDEILEADCGVWWGASSRDGAAGIEELERITGRGLDMVYMWHAVDQPAVPNAVGRRHLDEGRLLHANVEAREFRRPGNPATTYHRISAGDFDSSLSAQAEAIAELEVPFFLTFDHEADANKRYNTRGTPEEFVEAWRHIVDLYREHGADNAIWVWNVTGFPGNFHRLPGLWPGNDYVDWLSWEAYNMTGCPAHPHWNDVISFEESFAPLYEWMQDNGPEHGIDIDKPVMLGEIGTTALADPRVGYRWYRDAPDVLRDYDRVRAVKLWDSKTEPECDFRPAQSIGTKLGYILASRDPYVNIPPEVREQLLSAQEEPSADD
jgi:hypothetical protein